MKFQLFSIFSLILVTKLTAVPLIATGSKSGTYYRFGKEIAKVCGNRIEGRLGVLPTKGSLDNINKLLLNPNVKFAIVQQDALEYFINSKNLTPQQKSRIKELRVVMPLYSEEVHLLIRKDLNIYSFRNLTNLRIAVDYPTSGTYVTAKNIARLTKIKWEESILLPMNKKTLGLIQQHKIDAVFKVAGAPTKLLNVKPGDRYYDIYQKNFTFVDASDILPALENKYAPSFLYRDDYKWIDKDIETLAVPSILVTYNYQPYQTSYKRVKKLYQCIYKNINRFKREYGFHPKWSEVDPADFTNISWKIHPAVNEYLNTLKSTSKNKKTKEQSNNNTNNNELPVDKNFFSH